MSLIRIFIHVVKKLNTFYAVHLCLLKLVIDILSCSKSKSSWCCAILAPIKSRYMVIYTRIKSTVFALYCVKLSSIIADEIGKNREVLQHMPRVLIVIRVLVNESEQINEQGVFKMLRVQEEIVEVDKQALTQIKVTQLVLKLDSANNELIGKRVVTTIELKDSDVHKIPRDKDNHRYPDGKYC